MSKFYVTFGQKYRLEPHPRFDKADPDGVLEIEAQDIDVARRVANGICGPYWSGLYNEDEYKETKCYYPLGILESV